MKVITVCGSLKFQNEIMEVAEKLNKTGVCVLTPVYPYNKELKLSDIDIDNMKKAHFKRIELSDSIFVVHVNGYVGESTKKGIEFAKEKGKDIIYYTDFAHK